MRTHLRKPEPADRSILTIDGRLGPILQNKPQHREAGRLTEAQRMSEVGRVACSVSHDMRQALSAIYANLEFLEVHDRSAGRRTDLLLEIREAVLAMTARIDSLLQFARSGRNDPLVHQRISFAVERAITAVKFHPDGWKVSVTVGELPAAKAAIDARNLESAIYNLLLNACQAAASSTRAPEVNIHASEVGEQIYVTISDNGPGIPVHVRKTLFDPFVTAGKPNGTGLGLTLARRIAEEHGGSVRLVESNPGKTVFTLSVTKSRSAFPKV